ncbi:MAG: cytochrome b/b6 domain-containing protein [Sideroxyarcus sp.]|nr:cytochrome b/b6 domain-containing protein [Sideroxyarcus sp.]
MTSDNSIVAHKVWDLPTRLFHWSLLALIIASWWTSTENGDMDWHMRCGYAVLALLLFRLVWGVLGSTTARFSSFVSSPRAVLVYFAEMRKGAAIPHIGHNPAGGWMVLALLGLVLLISASGLFANDDMMSEGPLAHYAGKRLSDLATAWHERGFDLLLALVALHVAAILFYLFGKKENLVRPMLSGIKHLPQGAPKPSLHFGSVKLALLILGCASGAVWMLVRFA